MATQTSTQTLNLPDWIAGPWRDTVNRAVTEANQPYTPYPGQRLAPLTADQVAAQNLVRNSAGRTAPLITAATDLATSAGAANTAAMAGRGPSQVDPNKILGVNPMKFTDLDIEAYMNPWLETVAADTRREADLQAQAMQNRAKQAATAAGAFGGSRGALLETETAKNSERAIQDLMNRLFSQGFESARQTGEADLGRQYNADATYAGRVNDSLTRNADAVLRAILGAGSNVNALTGAARNAQAVTAADAQMLQGIGAQNQGQNQKALDLAVQDYLAQKGYTWDQINKLMGVLTGAGTGQRSTTTTGPGPNELASWLGLGITGLGTLGKYTNALDWLGELGGSGIESLTESLGANAGEFAPNVDFSAVLDFGGNGAASAAEAVSGLGEWLYGF